MGNISTHYELQELVDKNAVCNWSTFKNGKEAIEKMNKYHKDYGSDARIFRVVEVTRKVVAQTNDMSARSSLQKDDASVRMLASYRCPNISQRP